VTDYGEVLRDLQSKRAEVESRRRELDAAISAIQRIQRSNGQHAGEVNNAKVVLEFLAQNPMRIYTVKAIAAANSLPEKAVRGAVGRLWEKKKIERIERGKYRLREHHKTAAA